MKSKTETIPLQSLIDRSNAFYLEMSRKFLSQRDYDVVYKLLIEKIPLKTLADEHHVSSERIRQIYEKVYSKVKYITETLQDIESYIRKKHQLQEEYLKEVDNIPKRRSQGVPLGSNDTLLNSTFKFSRRMQNMFEFLEVQTLGQLIAIPLNELKLFRGFKRECKKELIAFIEFEKIEYLFEGFYEWKE